MNSKEDMPYVVTVGKLHVLADGRHYLPYVPDPEQDAWNERHGISLRGKRLSDRENRVRRTRDSRAASAGGGVGGKLADSRRGDGAGLAERNQVHGDGR